MGSFLVSEKSEGRAWAIDSWENDRGVAEGRAAQLVTKPFMSEAASVTEVGGSGEEPTFTSVAITTRRPQ